MAAAPSRGALLSHQLINLTSSSTVHDTVILGLRTCPSSGATTAITLWIPRHHRHDQLHSHPGLDRSSSDGQLYRTQQKKEKEGLEVPPAMPFEGQLTDTLLVLPRRSQVHPFSVDVWDTRDRGPTGRGRTAIGSCTRDLRLLLH